MKTRLSRVALVLVALALAAMVVSVVVSRPQFDERLDRTTLAEIRIAPPGEALTFARYRRGDDLRLLLVTRYASDQVAGADLGELASDALLLFRERGYDAILPLAATAPSVTVRVADLDLPFDAPAQNIGIGTNYREHARESGLEEQPFVFPKIAQPTPFGSAVAKRQSRLLDYEAELGLVALDDILPGQSPPRMGLLLCNELTDRWALVKNLRRGTEMGTTGFADGKSREGFAVLGPLLVIPRDLAAFYRRIELSLWVNGGLRQRDSAANMVWPPQQILDEVLRRSEAVFHYKESTVPLLPGGKIRAGTVIFSGTPAGVIFKPLNLWNPWVYLRPGDEVVIRADFLGTIVNRIVD
jgi:2,4-didehydro-3-deoxy-L-rhamnonate hydrolase